MVSRPLDKFDCYELSAQSPEYDAKMLRAIHGFDGASASPRAKAATVLGEDFCGSAAISRAWVNLDPANRAIAVDHDAPTIARARRAAGELPADAARRISFAKSDVLREKRRVDVLSVQNFSICEFLSRPPLIRYLSHVRSRLSPRGIFACDIYSGSDVFFMGRIHKSVKAPGGARISYTWEQRIGDPLSARVVNAMHFEIRYPKASGLEPVAIPNAFVYDWRLWSPAELADALREAGFRTVQFFPRFAEAIDDDERFHVQPIEDGNELSDSFSVYVVGRTK